MKNLENNYRKIIESLKLLALPFEKQKEYFPDFVDVPFEILDTFNNAILTLPTLIENELFSFKEIAYLLRVKNLIHIIVENPLFEDLEETYFENDTQYHELSGGKIPHFTVVFYNYG